jgi:hypothetical protein
MIYTNAHVAGISVYSADYVAERTVSHQPMNRAVPQVVIENG